MSRTAIITVLAVLAVAWSLLAITAGIAEAMVRRRMAEMRDLEEWRAKVDAMRRIYEQEGDA